MLGVNDCLQTTFHTQHLCFVCVFAVMGTAHTSNTFGANKFVLVLPKNLMIHSLRIQRSWCLSGFSVWKSCYKVIESPSDMLWRQQVKYYVKAFLGFWLHPSRRTNQPHLNLPLGRTFFRDRFTPFSSNDVLFLQLIKCSALKSRVFPSGPSLWTQENSYKERAETHELSDPLEQPDLSVLLIIIVSPSVALIKLTFPYITASISYF